MNMALVKRKTFEFEDDLADAFEGFCRSRMLVEKRIVVALVRKFMRMSPEERETLLLEDQPPVRRAASGNRGKRS